MSALFAITDIETTGSYASGNSIIEIGVCVHDGKSIIREYHTLLNPGVAIPPFITALTSITPEMISDAPTFSDVADKLEEVLEGCIFVAHNVAFDYSFIRAEFAALGKNWSSKKLCTVKLARKAFPGYKSYSLGNICRTLNITNEAAHRALGDARATTQLFDKCVDVLGEKSILQMVSITSGEVSIPPNLDKKEFEILPQRAGVYYFLNEKGNPIYIGKARNLKKRVQQHFTSISTGKRHQDFMRQIHHIAFEETGTELIALLLEDYEIRKYWPIHNKAQKKNTTQVQIINYTDRAGYERLAIQIGTIITGAIKTCSSFLTARKWLMEMASQFDLDPRLIGMDMFDTHRQRETPENHNAKLANALEHFLASEPSFVIKDSGRNNSESSYVVIEKGNLRGYCFLNNDIHQQEIVNDALTTLPKTETNIALIASICARKSF